LFAEAEEDNLDWEVKNPRFERWDTCSLCKQEYHGVVKCALGWACWKTNLGRPETDQVLGMAMNVLGNGLSSAEHYEDVLPVQEAVLSLWRRVGAPEENILAAQSNLALTFRSLGRVEEAVRLRRDVYFGYVKLYGEEHVSTLMAANNFADLLRGIERFEEAKLVVRKIVPMGRRILGESNEITLKIRLGYAMTLCLNTGATLDDLREAVTTLEETEPIARRVLGGAHPLTSAKEVCLRHARETLRARETPPANA
jgi:hypothetical protein